MVVDLPFPQVVGHAEAEVERLHEAEQVADRRVGMLVHIRQEHVDGRRAEHGVRPAAALRNRSDSVRSLVLAASFAETFAWALDRGFHAVERLWVDLAVLPTDRGAEFANPGQVVGERRSRQDRRASPLVVT